MLAWRPAARLRTGPPACAYPRRMALTPASGTGTGTMDQIVELETLAAEVAARVSRESAALLPDDLEEPVGPDHVAGVVNVLAAIDARATVAGSLTRLAEPAGAALAQMRDHPAWAGLSLADLLAAALRRSMRLPPHARDRVVVSRLL